MSYPSVTYTFSNSTTADATQINQNFTDLINGLSDGTKDLSISALTVAGTATLNGAINLGNSTSDDITITGYLASSFIPKTNQTYDIGTADLGLRALYLGVASAGALTAKVIASASIAADRIFTVPEAGTDASFVMTAGTQTISGAKTFDTAGNAIKGITSGGAVASGYIGETLESSATASAATADTGGITSITLTPGKWAVSGYGRLEDPDTGGGSSTSAACWVYLYFNEATIVKGASIYLPSGTSRTDISMGAIPTIIKNVSINTTVSMRGANNSPGSGTTVSFFGAMIAIRIG